MYDCSEGLGAFWKEGLFDKLIFDGFADAKEYSECAQKVIVEACLRKSVVSGGSFVMGARVGTHYEKDMPLHKVTLRRGFEICRYACTQVLYEHIMGHNPSYRKNAFSPVDKVSWCDAIVFCNRLSEREGLEPVYQVPGPVVWNTQDTHEQNSKRRAKSHRRRHE